MRRNPNYDEYLTTATQLQRWRDFLSHVTAYVVVNAIFVALWAQAWKRLLLAGIPAHRLGTWAQLPALQRSHTRTDHRRPSSKTAKSEAALDAARSSRPKKLRRLWSREHLSKYCPPRLWAE